MANTSLTNFLGMTPRWEHHLIQDTAAYHAIDVDTWSGGLVPFRSNTLVAYIDRAYVDFYRFVGDGRKQWLLFDSKVDIVRSPQEADVGNVCYITGIGEMRVFDTNTVGPNDTTITLDNSYKAGLQIPTPPTLGTVNQANAGASARSLSYMIAYGREWASTRVDLGPTSDVAKTTAGLTYVDTSATVVAQLTNITVGDNSTDEHTNLIVIYRVATGTESADWREVVRFRTDGVGTLPTGVIFDGTSYTFTDTYKDTDLGEVPTNQDNTMPEGLVGLTSLHNGILAAFKDNMVYFSKPYLGHAWPETYSISLDFNVVGLGSFGNTLVICTNSNTYMCVVSDPTQLIFTPIQEAQTCVSKDSIVSVRDSVIYAAPYGLIQVTANGAANITETTIGIVRWGDYVPESISAAPYNGNYLFFYTSSNLPYTGALFNLVDQSFGMLGFSRKPHAVWHDDSSSTVFAMYTSQVTNKIGIYAFGSAYSLGKVFTWTSKKFMNNYGLTTLSAFKLNFFPEYSVVEIPHFIYEYSQGALNAPIVDHFSINGDANTWSYMVSKYGADQCGITIYGDDKEWTRFNVSSNDFVRIPAGRRFDSWFCKVTSTIPVMRVQFSTSAAELE